MKCNILFGAMAGVVLSAVCLGQAAVEPKRGADFIEVPLKGEFGKEILASGVKRALTRAKNEGVQHVVFVLDSGGGRVVDAEAIAEVMREFDGSFTYHAVIKQAFSASLWVLVNCDHWYAVPGAATGAAVVYRQKVETGNVEVNAKMNGAIAATLASAAEAKGHSGPVVKSMVLMDARLYLKPGAAGVKDRLASETSAGAVEVDGPQSVLSATLAQLVEWGVAEGLEGTSDLGAAVGKRRGHAAWKGAGNAGTAAMKSAAGAVDAAEKEKARALESFQNAVQRMSECSKSFEEAEKAAAAVDPDSVSLYRDSYGNVPFEQQRQFSSLVDQKVAALNTVVTAGKQIADQLQKAKLSATAYENAHRRLLESAGLKGDALGSGKLEVPTVPDSMKLSASNAQRAAQMWSEEKRRRIGRR